MSADAATNNLDNVQLFRSPSTVIGRFVARRTIRGALIWAIIFGIYVASKAIGFVDIYPTLAARQKIIATFSNNVGIKFLLGQPPRVATTAAYVAWNTGGIIVVIGAIWGLLAATKYFRGEEESGRLENMLSGQTTAKRAALNVLCGLGISLVSIFIVLSLLLTLIGKSHGVDFNTSAALLFALVSVLGITTYVTIGAVFSQLFSSRGQAAAVSAIVLAVCYIIRGIADLTSMHWLLDITPLGWIEKFQPLANIQPLWLIPFAVLILSLASLSVILAGRRDYGESILTARVTSTSKFRLLNSPLEAAIKLSRGTNFSWLSGIFISSVLYGLIAKSTAPVLSGSAKFDKAVNRLTPHSSSSGVLIFLGIVYLLQMLIIMFYAASSISSVRRDEAEGYVDNFLVRPLSRLRWFYGRLVLIVSVIILSGLVTTLGLWLTTRGQATNVSLSTLFLASVNAIVPAILTLAIGVFVYCIRPRLTTALAYGVLAWSFLISMLSSGVNVNHWILDTSVLHQVVLAPTTNPAWRTNAVIVIISLILIASGSLFFNKRDIANE